MSRCAVSHVSTEVKYKERICFDFQAVIVPDEDDRRFVAMPESLSALCYLVWPVRLGWKEITGQP
jgi:hypothetical protein